MHAAVEGWADEVVHGGVDDDEMFAAICFGVEDAGEQNASWTNDGTAGLEEQVAAKRFEDSDYFAGVIGNGNGIFVGVANAEAAAEVDVSERNAGALKLRGELREPTGSKTNRAFAENLGSDVGANSLPLNPR